MHDPHYEQLLVGLAADQVNRRNAVRKAMRLAEFIKANLSSPEQERGFEISIAAVNNCGISIDDAVASLRTLLNKMSERKEGDCDI